MLKYSHNIDFYPHKADRIKATSVLLCKYSDKVAHC